MKKEMPSASLRGSPICTGGAEKPSRRRLSRRSQAPARWSLLLKREDARRDEDGHCTVCGCSMDEWDETESDHICPPGFRIISPESANVLVSRGDHKTKPEN